MLQVGLLTFGFLFGAFVVGLLNATRTVALFGGIFLGAFADIMNFVTCANLTTSTGI